MNIVHQCRTGVALLRPWPFGPPLRGRAPQHNAGTLTASTAERHVRQSPTSTSPPVEGLASHSLTDSVL